MRSVALQSYKLRLLSTTSLRESCYQLSSTLCLVNHGVRRPWLLPVTKIHERGAKSKATVPLKDLQHDGGEVRQPLQETQDDGPGYPAVVQQARNNMRKFENCVLLTRVGSFYELYFEQADEYGPLLNLKVAQKKTAAGLVSMSGFPFFQLDRFLKILVQDLNKFVAISEEFANNASGKVKSGGLLFDRKVTRIITPGTLIDEKFMDPYENNFLLALYPTSQDASPKDHSKEVPVELLKGTTHPSHLSASVGLAWLDLSTGDFFTQSIHLGTLPSAIARIGAREIVLSKDLGKNVEDDVLSLLQQERHLVTYHPAQSKELSYSSWASMLESPLPAETESNFSPEEVSAGSLLLAYVSERLQGLGIKLQPPVRRFDTETMGIDRNSMRGLEVLETSRDGVGGGKGSLLHTVRRTVTKSGTRLLKNWIASPSMSLPIINARLDLVSEFLHDQAFREHITDLLRRSYDCQRLVQKFSMGRGDGDDMMSLLRTIEATNGIASLLEKQVSSPESSSSGEGQDPLPRHSLQALSRRLAIEGPTQLASQIAAAIDEEGLIQSHRNEQSETASIVSMAQDVLQSEGSAEDQVAMSRVVRSKDTSRTPSEQDADEQDTWIMRRSASPLLQKLHDKLTDLRSEKASLTSSLREKLGAQSLTLRWTPGFGHICHIKGVKDVRTSLEASANTRDVKTTKSTRSFYHPEWINLGARIDQVKLQIKSEEQRVFQELREGVVRNLVKLRRNAAVLDELDIARCFATLADEQGFVRPTLKPIPDHKIIGGRHPTVKLGLEEEGRAFVSNNCLLGDKERIWLITGPNMGGKSTFLRQNALISILAQVGSFVPADYAEIGLVDRIFTRVGSADNLFRDQSTFMVEMLETAAILNQATPRSFVIMDEIGRGTTPEDGVAVGYACLHHLYHKNRCRTLFATHFHVLADMAKTFEKLGCYCTDVAEGPAGSFSYVHRLRRGVNRNSHALKVARLAGMPESAIETAREVLANLDHKLPSATGKAFHSDAASWGWDPESGGEHRETGAPGVTANA